MAEEKKPVEDQAAEKEKGAKAKKAGSKKPAAKKKQAKKAAENKSQKVAEAAEEKSGVEAEAAAEAAREEKAGDLEEEARGGLESEQEEELSEEELRRLVEESLEKVTVADIALNMMNQLASVGYLKMGLPESVNLKYRDFDQARLAIDVLEAMIKGAEGKVHEDALQAFRGTLANLQMNFVQLKGHPGGI